MVDGCFVYFFLCVYYNIKFKNGKFVYRLKSNNVIIFYELMLIFLARCRLVYFSPADFFLCQKMVRKTYTHVCKTYTHDSFNPTNPVSDWSKIHGGLYLPSVHIIFLADFQLMQQLTGLQRPADAQATWA